MSHDLYYVALHLRALTYSEMKEVAAWLAQRASINSGDDFDQANPIAWANILIEWAETWAEANPEEPRR